MELFIALVLFVGMIVTWLVLPGSASTSTVNVPQEAPAEVPSGVRQLA